MPTASTLLKIDTPACPGGRSALPANSRVHQLSIDGYRRAVTHQLRLVKPGHHLKLILTAACGTRHLGRGRAGTYIGERAALTH